MLRAAWGHLADREKVKARVPVTGRPMSRWEKVPARRRVDVRFTRGGWAGLAVALEESKPNA
jgi:hypothetical protein